MIGLGAALAAIALAGPARAEEGQGTHRFGNRGFIISADRLLPLLSYQSVTTTPPGGPSTTESRTSVALLNNGPFGVYNSFYNLPRLGFDWLPIDNLTLGGAAWLYTDLQASETTSTAGVSKSTDTPKATYWGIAPRIGYVFRMGDMLSLWPRVGIEYNNVSYSDVGAGSQSVTQLAFDGEAMLVVSPWNHFGFMIGPTLDAPISGEQTTVVTTTTATTSVTSTVRDDSKMWQVGLSAGMLGHF
jgi:opacity protein-like surface antigen